MFKEASMQNNENLKKIYPSAQLDFSTGITLNGITEIVSSSDKTFVARAGEEVLTVQGERLRPKLIDIEKNTAVLGGRIYAVSSSKQLTPKGFFAKIFK